MRHDRPVGKLKALGALVVLLAVVAGAPAAVLAAFGWPLTRAVLDVRRWPDALTAGDLSDDAVVRVLVTVALAVLAYLLVCALSEVVALARRTDRSVRTRNPLSQWVRHLVAVAAVLVATARPSFSVPTTVAPPATVIARPPDAQPPGVAAAPVVAPVDQRPGTVVVVAGRRDTLYSLAVRHLGDGERRDELLELNLERVMVDGSTFDGTVRPGYRMLIPAATGSITAAEAVRVHVVRPGDTLWSIAERHLGDGALHAAVQAANVGREVAPGIAYLSTTTVIHPGWQLVIPEPSAAAVPAPADAHIVQPGESVWSIAADALAAQRGGSPADSVEVAAFVERIVELNADRFERPGHPELIRPGQLLVLPSLPGALPAADPLAPPTVAPPTAADPPTVELPAPTTADAAGSPGQTATDTPVAPDPAVTPALDPADGAVASAPASLPPPDAPSAPPAPLPTGAPPASLPAPSPSERAEPGDVRVFAGLAGAVVLASGALAVAVRLRHRRLNRRAPGRRIAPAPVPVAHIERALHHEADVELARWAPLALRHLAPRLVHERGSPMVAEVRLDANGVEVVWESPQAAVPAPWQLLDGGFGCRLARHEVVDVPDGVVPPCPALVTVGRRDDASVLVDLEAAGLVQVVGPPERVAAFGRAVALELAVSDFADLLDIRLVGLPTEGFEHLSRVRAVASLDQALAWARPIRLDVDALLDRQEAASLFELRARQGATAVTREPLVLLVAASAVDGSNAAALADVCAPGRGVAAVVLGESTAFEAPVTIHLGDDGEADVSWRHGRRREQPIEAAQLAAPTVSALGALFDHAAAADEHGDAVPLRRARVGPLEEPPVDVEVRLLGPVAIGAPGAPDWDGVAARTLELIAWLATRSGPAPGTQAQSEIWPGHGERAARSFNHHVALARARLGDLDGVGLLLPSPVDGGYALSDRVGTDVDRLERRVRWAGGSADGLAAAALREGLSWVRGRPFTARTGYAWAHVDQLVFRAEQLVVDAAHRLAQLCLATGDPEGAVWATAAGLRGRPGDELLYQLRMRAFGAMGSSRDVRLAMTELCTELQDLAGLDEPSDATTELYEQLIGRERSA